MTPTIYTRSGDEGETYAPLAGRVPKTHPCVEAVGDLDEAESILALAEAEARSEGDERLAEILAWCQEALFRIGFQLWQEGLPEHRRRRCVSDEDVAKAEKWIDELLPTPPRLFQLHPADRLAATIAYARAVTRRAERSLWRCIASAAREPSEELRIAARLLNRLSDLLFAAEYSVAKRKGLERHVACR